MELYTEGVLGTTKLYDEVTYTFSDHTYIINVGEKIYTIFNTFLNIHGSPLGGWYNPEIDSSNLILVDEV